MQCDQAAIVVGGPGRYCASHAAPVEPIKCINSTCTKRGEWQRTTPPTIIAASHCCLTTRNMPTLPTALRSGYVSLHTTLLLPPFCARLHECPNSRLLLPGHMGAKCPMGRLLLPGHIRTRCPTGRPPLPGLHALLWKACYCFQHAILQGRCEVAKPGPIKGPD